MDTETASPVDDSGKAYPTLLVGNENDDQGISQQKHLEDAERTISLNPHEMHERIGELGSETEVVLPGYAAGSRESGIGHSLSKLRSSANRLSAKLEEIYCSSSSVRPNKKSMSVIHQPMTTGGSVQTFHCRDENETWTYRCRCNFQIVRAIPGGSTATLTQTTNSIPMVYRYAMRSMGKPVLLGTKNSFPIATRRIQAAMEEFMDHLNKSNDDDNDSNKSAGIGKGGEDYREKEDMIGYNGHLTSCTFSSAWRDSPDSDCVLTLHYDHPINGDGTSGASWKQQAQLLCQKMRLRQLNGRSKGTLLSVTGGENSESAENNYENSDGGGGADATIRDTIFLLRRYEGSDSDANDCPTTTEKWVVTLESDFVPPNAKSTVLIPVYYDKPETAFYHPNRNAMTTALAWMLNQLAQICSSPGRSPRRKLNILEMYCGCGAHTVALGRSGMVSRILAVELDPRLVRACEANVARNSLQDLVEVRRGDAGRWAKEESRKRRSKRRRMELAEGIQETCETLVDDDGIYDVLLVDPPRQGLDEDVCRMAMMTVDGEIGTGENCFRNILYVSCGHFALLRDLERLAPAYQVVSCAQMDLFPRTDSIETLVHLKRRA